MAINILDESIAANFISALKAATARSSETLVTTSTGPHGIVTQTIQTFSILIQGRICKACSKQPISRKTVYIRTGLRAGVTLPRVKHCEKKWKGSNQVRLQQNVIYICN
jgi:hypothetical protein